MNRHGRPCWWLPALAALSLVVLLVWSASGVDAAPASSPNGCDLTVHGPNGTYVEIYDGSRRVASGTIDPGTSKVFALEQGTYDVKLRQGSAWFTFTDVDCTGAAQTLNGLASLTVNAPGGTYVDVYKGSARATLGTVPSGETLSLDVVRSAGLTVKLRQGSAWFSFPADCSGGSATIEALAALTVHAPAGTYVEVYRDSQLATQGTVGGGKSLVLKVVRYDNYTVKLRQGSAWFTFTGQDCDAATCGLSKLSTLNVTAPNDTYVEVYKGTARATLGTVGAVESLDLDVVTHDGYLVKLRQGSAWFDFGADCDSGTCAVAALTELSVQAPSGTYIEVYKDAARAATGTIGDSKSLALKLVRYHDYTVKLRQGSAWFSFAGQACSGASCSLDALRQLTVEAPNGSYIEVYGGAARVTGGTVASGTTLILDVVLFGDYTVQIRQGSAWFTFSGTDCTVDRTLHALCAIELHAPSGTYVEVYKGAARATVGTVGASGVLTLAVVRYNGYTVKMRYGSTWYQFTNVDAESRCPAVLDKHDLTVKFPGLKLNRVTIKNQSGGTVTYRDWPQDEVSFKLAHGTYDIVLQHGAEVKTVEDVFLLGSVVVQNIVSDVTVHFDGMKLNRATIQTPAGGTVTYKDWPQDTYQVTLLRDTYKVVLQHGAASRTVDLDATGATGSVARNLVVCDLTIEFPNMRLNRVTVLTTGGGTVIYKDWPENQWVVPLLQNTYDVQFQHGAKTKLVEDVDCTGTSKTLDSVVSDVTLTFTGMRLNRVTIKTSAGGTVIYRDWPQDSWTVTLLRNTYDVEFKHGAQTITRSLDATAATGQIPRDQIVCDLSIEFPGMRLNRVTILTTGNGTVTYRDWPTDRWDVPLLQATYDVQLQHGAKVKVVGPVDCTGTSQGVTSIVSELTVSFPGFKAQRVTVKTLAGGTVMYRDWPSDQAIFILLKNHYLVDLSIGGKTATQQVDCTGDTCVLAKGSLTVAAPHGTFVEVKKKAGARVGAGTVGTAKSIKFSNLDNGLYDVFLTQGAATKTVPDVLVFGATDLDELCRLTVKAPHGTYVEVRDGGKVVEATVGTSKQVGLDVIKKAFDVFLKQGAGEKTESSVDCTVDDRLLDQLAKLTVEAPHGAYVEVRPKGGSGQVTAGTIGTSKTIALDVVRNRYDVFLKQGTGTKLRSDEDVTSDLTMDELFQLTIKAPHGTYVEVQESGKVTSATVGTGKQVALDVIKKTFNLRLVQGAGTKDAVTDCATGESAVADHLSTVTVAAPHGAYVEVRPLGTGLKVTSGTVGTAKSVALDVVSNHYDVFLSQGAALKTRGNEDITSDLAVDELCVLTVKAPHGTYVEVKDGGKVTSATVGTGKQVALDVIKKNYTLYLQQGAGTTNTSVDCTGETLFSDQLCALTVTAPHGTYIEVRVVGTSSKVVGGTIGTAGSRVFDVIRSTWDVTDMTTITTTDCTGPTASASF